MIEDKEGDAEKNEAVDVQLNNTKAAPPFSLVDDRLFNHHRHFKCVCLLTWSPGEEGRLLNVRTIESPDLCPPP
jgi:hypothetical protein